MQLSACPAPTRLHAQTAREAEKARNKQTSSWISESSGSPFPTGRFFEERNGAGAKISYFEIILAAHQTPLVLVVPPKFPELSHLAFTRLP